MANTEKPSFLKSSDFFPALFLILYLVVELIPDLGAYDTAGPQWGYLSAINLGSLIYIISDKKSLFINAIEDVTTSLLTRLYLLYIFVAGISIVIAANKVESLCAFTSLLTTLGMYVNIAIILYRRMHLFPLIAGTISIFLTIQALQILYQFYLGLQHNIDLDIELKSLTLHAAHKNILAASMVFKFPFLLYTIYRGRLRTRLLALPVLALAVSGLVILNARTAYLSLLFIVIVYLLFFVRDFFRIRSTKTLITNLVGVITVFVIGILLSNVLISHTRIYTSDFYGTFLQKMSSIKISNQGSDNRFWLWGNALSYIKNHPFIGCGYGNWKLAAIPYEKYTLNELIVSLNVHNDFLETTAETGVVGGSLFFSIFIVLGWFIVKPQIKKYNSQLKEITPVLMTILVCYFLDASLNFPKSRPIMQCYFALTLGLCYNFFYNGEHQINPTKKIRLNKFMFGAISLPVLIPTIILQVFIYQSLVAQKQFSDDSLKVQPTENWDDVNNAFPFIPNINIQCLPIGEIKAKYLIKGKMYDEALTVLRNCYNVNPALGYNDYLQGIVFFKINKIDSAWYCAAKAFNKRPRALPFSEFLLTLCLIRNDRTSADQVFKKAVALNNNSRLWIHYIQVLSNLHADKSTLLSLTDKAQQLFIDDEEVKKLKNNLAAIYANE